MSDEQAEANYEDVTKYDLDESDERKLLLAHNECTFIWSNKQGWPVGVIMSYIWRNGRFWITGSEQRARFAAVKRDPRVCVVVTSTGSPIPRGKAITWKGMATLHSDQATKDWFYPELSAALNPDAERAKWFQQFLDSPRRVIMEIEPTQRIGYDGAKMGKDTAAWIAQRAAKG
jgi:general stress protein 26